MRYSLAVFVSVLVSCVQGNCLSSVDEGAEDYDYRCCDVRRGKKWKYLGCLRRNGEIGSLVLGGVCVEECRIRSGVVVVVGGGEGGPHLDLDLLESVVCWIALTKRLPELRWRQSCRSIVCWVEGARGVGGGWVMLGGLFLYRQREKRMREGVVPLKALKGGK